MTAYINTTTNEYPRHAGDIALDPEGTYEPVAWVDQPDFDRATQRCYEGAPEKTKGGWRMTWIVRDATPEEIEAANKPFDPFERP